MTAMAGSMPPSGLQPKELFGDEGCGPPSPQPLWGLTALHSLSLSKPPEASGNGAADDRATLLPCYPATPPEASGNGAADACGGGGGSMHPGGETGCASGGGGEEPPAMFALIHELFSADSLRDEDSRDGRDSRAPRAAASAEAETQQRARQAFMRKHGLERLVALAVDRAIKYNVSSPVEFVAHELLRATEPAQPTCNQSGQ